MENMLTSKDYENMGKEAAAELVSSNKPLNETITKLAESYGLNTEQTARVIEHANVETYLKLNKVSDDKYIEFDPADPVKIASALNYTIKKEAALLDTFNDIAISEDFIKTSSVSLKQEETINKAEEKLLKKAEKEVRNSLTSKLEEIDESFRREDEKLYSLVKQASLELGNFGMVKEAMVQADQEGISKILVNIYETKLKKEAAARVNFEDTNTRGTLNTDHPIVKSLQKLAIFKEEYIEVKNQKDELEKAAMGGMTAFKLFLAGLATLGADTIKKAHDANNITNAKAKNYYNRAVSLRPI